MKTFETWGIKIRKDQERNYYSIWSNLRTIRLDLGPEIKLPYKRSEFYDVGITSRCNANCSFCYVSASNAGEDYTDISETWKKWMDTFSDDTTIEISKDPILNEITTAKINELGIEELKLKINILKNRGRIIYTEKPFQIAIGSIGEPTLHPELPRFLETVFNTGVVPNYTTNGIYLSPELLEATKNFCGGVAVSYGNKLLRKKADKTIELLIKSGECKVMIHHIISDKNSVDELLDAENKWGEDIHYHVLLPLRKHGRSKEEMTEDTFLYLSEKIKEENLTNLAFGMWFLPWMKKYPGKLNVYDYPRETYSSNMLLEKNKIIFTPSSFDLTEKEREVLL